MNSDKMRASFDNAGFVLASKIGKKELSMIGCFISAASFIL